MYVEVSLEYFANFISAAIDRVNIALSKLSKLFLPNCLIMDRRFVSENEVKALTPAFISPLKRKETVTFHCTSSDRPTTQHNKQLLESIAHAVGLDKTIGGTRKKPKKNMKDAAVQTTRPYCDVCEIRDSTKQYDAGTSISPEDFSSSVHTQVVEQDLVNSKSIFNPSGSVADGAPISIAHLTPAQLVSQLAARAKTLKQSEPSPPANQFGRRPNYDYDDRGQQYQNNYNYRY